MQISEIEFEEYRRVQAIAKAALSELNAFIEPGISEAQIASHCDELLREGGADSAWYHGVGSMVFVGERTALSMSGKDYMPSQQIVQKIDLVTVDVSPQKNGYWGDCARSFIVGESAELVEGKKFVEALHDYFTTVLRCDLKFGDLFEAINQRILDCGFENLDFRKNLGHTIEKKLSDRIFIERGKNVTAGEARLFTFEPHVRKLGGKYGFRKEDIYHFSGGVLCAL